MRNPLAPILEPPARYVAFVAAHLEPLRAEAAAVLGDDTDADRLYPEVLTDVALRWRWLELARAWLRKPGAAGRYAHQSLRRRSQRWQTRWVPQRDEGPEFEFVVWRPGTPRPVSSSGASRLAPYLRPTQRPEFGAVAEAAVAWWHAYEVHRRHRYIALAVVVLLLVGLLLQVGSR